MNITRLALSNPVAVIVAILLLLLFGALSLWRLPVQLTPSVDQPEITIRTSWRAAAPEEVEAEIIEPQEKVLRGLPGMTEMLSRAQSGLGTITITFEVGYSLERGLLEVLNRLNRVARYPEDADEPVLRSVGGSSRAIAWFIIKTAEGNGRQIASYKDYVEEVVQTRFERVPGVALSEVYGGQEREIRITFDPYRAASLGIELPTLQRLAGGGDDVSGGEINVGKRRYTLRFTGALDATALGELVVAWRDGKPVLLRELAEIEVRLQDRRSFVITKGSAAIAVNARREIGVNVLEVMAGLREAVAELRAGPLAQAQLTIEQVYDETVYIYSAIEMLQGNLGLGVVLAIAVLWWFLRRLRATLMIALAIPLALAFAFIVLNGSLRTLNVISLAGLAFAVGMVLDAAIVVLENIVRLREQGVTGREAAHQGVTQVWGALLASTVTTVAIFLPVVFLQDEAGQLFADLALAIAAAITASLLVALSVVPTAAHYWMPHKAMRDVHAHWWDSGASWIMWATASRWRRLAWIGLLSVIALFVTVWLLPKADYLPEGNRNLVFAFILPPPGVNVDHLETEMGEVIASRVEPYMTGEQQPAIEHYFFVAFTGGVFMGARAVEPERAGELVPVINSVVQGFPDTLAFAQRASLFSGIGGGRSIDVNIHTRDLDSLYQVALTAFTVLQEVLPGAQVRPLPGLELAEPELRLTPREYRLAEAGWDRQTMAQIARALGQGVFVGEYFDGEDRLDIILRAQSWTLPEALAAMPLATPGSGVVPVSELVDIERTAGPNEIRRLDRRRTLTLQVTPPQNLSLEESIEILEQQALPRIQQALPDDGMIRYSGTADKLQQALRSMGGSFLLAVVILYLLMSALFRSFVDSLLVLFCLPLATVGGVIALQLVNRVVFQPMDLLTMIGFIILLGLVVNNAILLVHQTRQAERDGLSRRDAVYQAVRLRLRPILMSTLTSIFGMLPLLLISGAGTELYRGLAAVIVGGMSVSTLFTLVLLPSLLQLGRKSSNL